MEEHEAAVCEKGPDIDHFFEILIRLFEMKHNIKIKYKLRNKTEEELNSEEMSDRLFIFKDEEE